MGKEKYLNIIADKNNKIDKLNKVHGFFDENYNTEDENDTDYEDYIKGLYEINTEVENSKYEIAKMNSNEENLVRKKLFDDQNKAYISGNIISDKEVDEDAMNREDMAQIIARHLVSENVDTPITLGVFGKWGEGKSSFLKLIQKEMKEYNKKSKKNKMHIIECDASSYDEKNKIWSSVLASMFKKYEEEHGFKSKFYGFSNFFKKINENWFNVIFNIIIIVFTLKYINIFVLGNKKINIGTGIIGIFPIVLFITNIIIPFILNQINFLKPISEKILSFSKMPDYSKNLGARENIKKTINELMNVWVRKNDDRVVIFIDELDRCTDKTINELFGAIQLFLPVKNLIIVLSLDYEIVCKAISGKNGCTEKFAENDKILYKYGAEYLKKYINIPMFLKETNDYTSYLDNIYSDMDISKKSRNMLKSIKEKDFKNGYIKIEKLFKKNEDIETKNYFKRKSITLTIEEKSCITTIVNLINKEHHVTPRDVKNIMNILIISKDIIYCKNFENEKCILDFNNFVYWFLFHKYFIDISEHIIKLICNNSKKEMKLIHIIDKNNINISNSVAEILLKNICKFRIQEILCYNDISIWFIGKSRTLDHESSSN